MASFEPRTGLWTTPLCGLTVDGRLKSVSLSHGMGSRSIPCESGHPQLLRGPEHGGNRPTKEGAGGSSSAQRARLWISKRSSV